MDLNKIMTASIGQKPSFGENFFFAILIAGSFSIFFLLPIFSGLETLENAIEGMDKEQAHYSGVVVKVEATHAEEPIIIDAGRRVEIHTNRSEYTTFYFKDGRSKKVIGMPKEEIPLEEDLTIVLTKYDILMEVLTTEEYRSKKENEEKNNETI